ncbi:MAG: hypothetical protein DRH15_01855 [Deltaproteobacteria bacterium]|nr:helix-turn-helix domain-containing protein [Deltaproteobacteria bacterium]RLB86335.1 MAG: hypothetical protein DRH15_01855 [Deltaproteobacteria bacterium]HDM10702.1 hypothetical protein [Desulfobacteraceae bacterium]
MDQSQTKERNGENIQEVGALLREAREAKGLSLDDVFEKTKLRPAVVRIVLPNQRIDRPWPMRSRPFCLKI